MSFENNIQKWVAVDNQLKTLNEKMKTLRETRNTLTGDITNYAEKNNYKQGQFLLRQSYPAQNTIWTPVQRN